MRSAWVASADASGNSTMRIMADTIRCHCDGLLGSYEMRNTEYHHERPFSTASCWQPSARSQNSRKLQDLRLTAFLVA